MTAWWVTGDVMDTLRALPDDSADLVLTSPPFLALRSYLPADHPDKKLEGGSQATPAAFLDWLLGVCDELGRVLAPHGTLCIELGDTYAGSGGAGGDYDEGGMRDGQPKFKANTVRYTYGEKDGGRVGTQMSATQLRNAGGIGWPLEKSLSLLPEAFRLSLAYGRNVLGGEWVGEPWRIRNVVRWVRPNPPVGALGDKFRPATTDVVVACRSRDRWFDLDAVREPSAREGWTTIDPRFRGDVPQGEPHETVRVPIPATAPPLDWLNIPTEPYKGSHYATWPRRLVVPFVESMCPRRVCRVCGEPSRRIVDLEPGMGGYHQGNGGGTSTAGTGRTARHATTLGWTDCGHDHWRPGRVLDPFAGSGTTGQVATGHARDAVLIDLDERNLDLARERVGMWLVETTAEVLAAELAERVPSGEAA